LSVEVIQADSAALNKIALAFTHSVLACETPTWTVSNASGVSVGIKIEVTDLPEILNHSGRTLVLAAVLREPTMNCWQ
jgi:hypothetical protein